VQFIKWERYTWYGIHVQNSAARGVSAPRSLEHSSCSRQSPTSRSNISMPCRQRFRPRALSQGLGCVTISVVSLP
jgi:hypothetical protein